MRRLPVNAERVRSLRESAGLTQESLAQRADLSLGAVRYIETGRTATPDKLTLQALATALGVPVDYITAPAADEAATA